MHFSLQTKKNDDFLVFSLLDQEEKKDVEGEEVVKDEENSKENQGVGDATVEEPPEQEDKQPSPEGCGVQEEKKTLTEEKTKVPRGQRRPKSLHIKVTLLDNTEFECELDVRATHQSLFSINCA